MAKGLLRTIQNATGDEVGEIVTRKQQREEGGHPQGPSIRKGFGGVPARGINKTLTIVGNRGILSPTVDTRANREIIGVEIRPNKRWVGGSTVPLWAFICLTSLGI